MLEGVRARVWTSRVLRMIGPGREPLHPVAGGFAWAHGEVASCVASRQFR